MRSTIICVDDEKILLNILYEQLETWFGKHYSVQKAQSGAEALQILEKCVNSGESVSVFISDYIMPIMKGDEVLSKVREISPKTKRIMLTGYSAIDGIINAINKAGIYRYITKPWDSKDLMLTLLEAIKSYEQDKVTSELSSSYEKLYHKYENLYTEKDKTYTSLLKSFARACDMRDRTKPKHSENVAKNAVILGKALLMDDDKLKILCHSALLHDLGKLAMSDSELSNLKKCQKYDSMFLSLRTFQVNFSEQILSGLESSDELIENIKYQFETFSGKGPFGLRGTDIPLGARIIHIANLFDVYSISAGNLPIESVQARLQTDAGIHLDPKLTSLFIESFNKINSNK